MAQPDKSELIWRPPRRCAHGSCVEVARPTGRVLIRDGKDPNGPEIVVPQVVWAEFLLAAKAGLFNLT